MFLGLGVMVASALATPRLIVPENGFISLNVPLTAARLGSFSTRTTHPHLIALLRTLLAEIGVAVQVTLPYRFSTKGEMIRQCANTAIMERSVSTTMSCARPGASRFTTLRSPNIHCGYCVPCLIRRAAIGSVMPDPTVYTVQDLAQPLAGARGVDLRAFKMALDRYRHQLPQLTDILAAGPLSGTDEELYAYLAVFRRGLNEMADLLHTYQEEPITYALG